MGGKCGGDQIFKSYSIFGITIFFFLWEMKTLLIPSDIIRNRNLYTSLLNETRPTPLTIKTPHTQQEGSPIPLSSNPLFFLYGELHFMDQGVFARREAAHTISSRSSRMPAGFQPISILDIRPPPEVKNHATWAKLTLSLLQDQIIIQAMIGHLSSSSHR